MKEDEKSPAMQGEEFGSSGNHSGKGKKFETQMKICLEAFFERPKTMLEVSTETGILRANLCRYCAEWLESGKIQKVRIGFCSISLHKAVRYSSNPLHWKGGENGG